LTDKSFVHDIDTLRASTHSLDTDLSAVRSFEKRQELFNTLHAEDACHSERLYLAGFLKFVGYSLDEICAIIDREASWKDYDRTMTYCQVQSVFKPVAKDATPSHPFLDSFEEGAAGKSPFTKGVSPHSDHGGSKLCIVGSSRITCYFKDCDLCKFKDLAGRAEK
jgi:hypothetical protein